MSLHGASEIPFECPLVVALDPKPHGIHDADQFLGVGIAGPRRRPEFLHRLLVAVGLHQVAGLLDLGKRRRARNGKTQDRGFQGLLHGFCSLPLIVVLSAPAAFAADLPAPLTQADFLNFDRKQAALGQLLFYDRILSGNRNIACATCHHPRLGTGDRLSLGIGEGGHGLGTDRVAGSGDSRIKKRIPRNAPGLWNLGAKELHTLFHDGRLSIADTFENGFNSPAEEWLPTGFNSLLAAQAVFPVTAQFEMAGNPKENEVAGAIHDRIDYAWPILAKRVRVIPEYGRLFVEAFDHIDTPKDVTIVEIANALAAFQAVEWQSFDSPFDRFLSGDDAALNDAQKRGLDLFFGEAGCSGCHSGKLLSDQKFHALGLPPFGPGRTRRFDPMVRDVGVMGETDRLEDAYRFRTPMLRNVELTAPYGHNGAYSTLEGIIRHHLDPDGALASWSPQTADLPHAPWLEAIDFVVWNDAREMARQARFRDIAPVALTDNDVADLIAFLKSLTGTTSVTTPPLGVPDTVPSGLPVDR
ncbi:cytochrome-c peroxidase [Roseibium sp. Sym1]|uniref:cytochrome-c peroxidase n=1 Tax=Roseibium sp. Sym1 TaxID=3016006 RepID=UPI0022B503C9|nr:cytochrome c peroxidase [Roseibium sp. Sym1]